MSITMTYQAERSTGIVERVRRFIAVRRMESSIFAELDALSDRDLADIGLVRFNLRDVAREAAAGAC